MAPSIQPINKNRLHVLKQVEVVPSDLVREVLNEDLFSSLKIEDPSPVLFLKMQGDFVGFCSDKEFTELDEIVIDEQLAGFHRTVSKSVAKRQLIEVFIHEYSHRVAPNHGHDAVFAATNLALMLRAQKGLGIPDLSHFFRVYDFHDHQNGSQKIGLADAFRFIVSVATELADSDLGAPRIAEEVEKMWIEYEKDVLARPARIEAEKRRQATAMSNLQHSLNDANQQKRDLFTYGVAAGCFFMLLALYVMKNFL